MDNKAITKKIFTYETSLYFEEKYDEVNISDEIYMIDTIMGTMPANLVTTNTGKMWYRLV